MNAILLKKKPEGYKAQNGFDAKESAKTDANAIDKVYEALGLIGKMTNANEAMQTTLTDYGEELVPDDVLRDELIDISVESAPLLSFLPGDHGKGLGKSESRPVAGRAPFMEGNPEWDGSNTTIPAGNKKVQTGQVTINQKSLILNIPISKSLLNYSVVDLESLLRQKATASAAKTITSAILNADSSTGATGNVNSDDQLAATTLGSVYDHRMWFDGGLRKLAIAGAAASSASIGTFARSSFNTLEILQGDLFGNDSLWILDQYVYNKWTALDDFSDASKRGEASTINGNAIGNVDGADVFKTTGELWGKAAADGKKDGATPANNTKGQLGLLYAPAVQYGFGQDFELDVVKIPGKGLCMIVTLDFGFTIMDQIAGETDRTAVLGYNITL